MKNITRKIIFIVSLFVMINHADSLHAQQDILISDGGTVYVSSGDHFYDAGGPTGDDGNTSYTITICPDNPDEKVAVDFTYYKTMWYDGWTGAEEDPLYIYDGTSATGNDIGKLMGDYSEEYNTGITPYGMGVEAYSSFPMIGSPTIFAATNASGCLTFYFENNENATYPGWEADITTYTPLDQPGCLVDFNPDTTICPGETVTLEASGNVVSAPINNDFNDGTIGTGWEATASATITSTSCVPSPDGTQYLWMQNAPGPRELKTNAMDVSNGGSISFEYRQAQNNGNASPCESPDQGGGTFEGVYLQYSIDGGTSWTTFKYIYPNGTEGSFGSEAGLTGCGDYVKRWTKMTYPIPPAAHTTSTKFRWVQAKVTSSGTDNWGLDNIIIATPNPTSLVEIEDLSTGSIIASSATIPLSVDVTPAVTKSYRATISDGVSSCDSIMTITVDPSGCGPEPCGTCATPDCDIAGPYADATEANQSGNHCSAMNTLTDPATDSTYVSYHTVTTGADGTLGLITSVGTTQLVGVTCDVTKSALLYPSDPCDPATAIAPDAINPNAGITFYNPEWNNLAPNTTYILEISFTVPAECQLDDHCESFYYPPVLCPASTGTLSVLINGVDVTDTSNQYDVCWGDQIDFNTNNDYVLPDPASSDPNGLGYVLWSSSPTDLTSPETNAGFLGFDYNQNTGDVNDGSGFPTGTFYLAPITFDDICNTSPCDAAQGYDVDGDGCWDIGDVIEFTFYPEIVADAGVDQTLTCGSPTVSLDGLASTGAGISYNWTGPGIVSGANTANPDVNTAGTYTLTITSPEGCTDTDDVVVNQDSALPTADAGSDQILTCATTSVNLDGSASASGADITYTWGTADGNIMNGTNSTSPEVNAAGTYIITVTDTNNGCTADDQVNVTEDVVVPTAGITNNTGTTVIDCNVPQIDVTATGGGTYDWSGGLTTAANSFASAGTYTVTVTGSNGCTSTDNISITEDLSAPTADAGADQTLFCNTASINLDGTASSSGVNFTYSWSTSGGNIISGINTIIPEVNAAGNYTITVTDTNNGCTAQDQVSVNEDLNAPNADAGADQVLTCSTTSLNLDGSSSSSWVGITYSWSTTGGNILNGNNSTTPEVNAAGIYTITVTDTNNGCTAQDQVSVSMDDTAPLANAGSDQTLTCDVTSLNLDGTGSSSGEGISYSWSTSGGNIVSGNNTNTPLVNAPGTYNITVSDSNNGCTAQDQVSVSEDVIAPIADAGPVAEINCTNPEVDLDGSSSSSGLNIEYLWSTADGNILSGFSNPISTVNQAGTYSLTVTNLNNGCTATSQTTVTTDISSPTVSVAVDQDITCAQPQVGLDGSGTSSGVQFNYLWTTPDGNIVSGANSLNPLVNQGGTYQLEVTNSNNGCTASASLLVAEYTSLPVASAGSDMQITCDDPIVTLDGSASSSGSDISYNWTSTDGNILSGNTSENPVVNAAGTYSIEVLNSVNGCSASDQVSVTENTTVPSASAGPDQELTCALTSLNLDGSASDSGTEYSILWTTPDGSIVNGAASLYPLINQQGSYTITIENTTNGCTANDLVNVSENFIAPIANAGTEKELTCSVTEVSLDGTGSSSGSQFSYQWSSMDGNIISNSDQLNPLVNDAGTYAIVVTDVSNGCTATDQVNVAENTMPPVASAGDDTQIACGMSSVTLDGSFSSSGMDFSYQWNTINGNIVSGETTLSPLVDAPGAYQILVTDHTNGCTASDDVVVTVPDPVMLSFNIDDVNCYNGSDGHITASVSGGTDPITYTWENGIHASQLSGLSAGYYNVTAVDDNGCSVEDSAFVHSPDQPLNLELQISNVLCHGSADGSVSALVSGGTVPYNYQWYNDNMLAETGANAQNLDAGKYSLHMTDANGCPVDTSFFIAEPLPLQAGVALTHPSCIGNNDGSVEIMASGGTSPYLYRLGTGSISYPIFDMLEEGHYDFVLTDANGCKKELETVTLIDNPVECLRIPNAFTPNGDGNNDIWIIENLDIFNSYILSIYNRWGQKLYQASPGDEPWDGKTTEGKFVPAGSYVYLINLNNGTDPKSGIVTVIY